MSGSFKGIDPPLEGAGGKGDDNPRFFTLNYAEILGFDPPHDPDHGHIGNPGAGSPDPTQNRGAPEVFHEFDRLDLVQAGLRGGPKRPQLLKWAQSEPELSAF